VYERAGSIPSIFDIRHSSEGREIPGCARLRGDCRLAGWPAPFKLHYVCRSSGLRQGPVRRNHGRAIRALLYRNTGDRFTTRFSKPSAERQLLVMVNELMQPGKRATNDPTKMGISLIRSLSDVEALPAPVGGGAHRAGKPARRPVLCPKKVTLDVRRWKRTGVPVARGSLLMRGRRAKAQNEPG
jgi:hypothetical protein